MILRTPNPYGQMTSVPQNVMRTGIVEAMSPYAARHNVRERDVEMMTRVPVGLEPGTASYAPPPVPSRTLGSDANGENVMEFEMPTGAGPQEAQRLAGRLALLARTARSAGFTLPIHAVGGPLASLINGSAIVLRFKNGVRVSVTP